MGGFKSSNPMTLKYSFIVPCFNDAYLFDDFCAEFESVFIEFLGKDSIGDDVELIVVDDGSSDQQRTLLLDTVRDRKYAKAVILSRNFGQHIAISCGYKEATGTFVGMLNADMQDPPREIPKLIERIEQGDVDIVYGLRKNRVGSWSEKIGSRLFHFLLNRLTGSSTPLDVSTLRLMNRVFTNAYNLLNEKSRFLPGLESWIGFKSDFVPIDHEERQHGRSSYNFKRKMLMAMESIISFSDLPLRVSSILGILLSLLGFFLIGFIVISKLFFIEFQPGYSSTMSAIIFVGGIQIFVSGLVGIYLGRVLKESQNRPVYIIREKVNFDT